jgi:hypothetical protein
MILQDGYPVGIIFADFGTVAFEVRELTPPSMQAGGMIPTTTQAAIKYRTGAPKKLITVTEGVLQVVYDAVMFNDIQSMLGHNQLISYVFEDTSKINVWGFVDQFNPAGMTEGNQPVANVRIEHTNRNNSRVETGPAYVAPAP